MTTWAILPHGCPSPLQPGTDLNDGVSEMCRINVCAQMMQIGGFGVIALGLFRGWVATHFSSGCWIRYPSISSLSFQALSNLNLDSADVIAPLQSVHNGAFQPRTRCSASYTDETGHEQQVYCGTQKAYHTRSCCKDCRQRPCDRNGGQHFLKSVMPSLTSFLLAHPDFLTQGYNAEQEYLVYSSLDDLGAM